MLKFIIRRVLLMIPILLGVSLVTFIIVRSIPGDPVQSAKNFAGELTESHFPWTALSIVLIIGVLAAAVVTRMLQVRARRAVVTPEPETPAPPIN